MSLGMQFSLPGDAQECCQGRRRCNGWEQLDFGEVCFQACGLAEGFKNMCHSRDILLRGGEEDDSIVRV